MLFETGKIYDVDDQTANYLVTQENIAEDADAKPAVPIGVTFAEDKRIRIALIRIGGIGDALQLAALAKAVKRKYPGSHTTLFVRDKAGYNAIEGSPAADQIVIAGNKLWKDLTPFVVNKGYSIVFDNRYITRVIYLPGQFEEDKKRTDSLFEPYRDLYVQFPLSCNKIAKVAGCSCNEFTLKTAGIIGGDDDLHIALTRDDANMTHLIDTSYVTIHNGADIVRQTKCWPTDKWATVVKYLADEKGYKVIQLGERYEAHVPGALDMTGRTTVKQAACLIQNARFHIDSEGGLVHVARAVKTRSIVLFGPTPIQFFGYKENINIATTGECKECWWTTDMWWRECPKKYPLPPKCMQNITVDQVIEAIKMADASKPMDKKPDMDDLNEQFAIDLPLTEAHYRSEQHQWDRVQTMMAKVRGKKVLEVGAGDGYCVKALQKQGYDVIATEVSQIRLKRMQDAGIPAIYADVNELPFPDKTFDAVMCGEVLEHIDSPGKGLAELERVTKDDGIIILSLPVGDDYRTIKMHKWGIGHHVILRQGKMDLIVLTLERINRHVHSGRT